MIEKKDWENALKQFEAMYINYQVNIAAYEYMMDFCKKKIAEFPEEKDEMPDDLKETLEEIKDA